MPIVVSITIRPLKQIEHVGVIMIMVRELIGFRYHANVKSELSYILQFVEKNGRNRGDPWSLRQTGVYQQVTFDSRQSAWIFLQLSSATRVVLEKVLRRKSSCPGERESPMTIHALLLGATVDNWGEYIQNLSTQLRDVVSWAIWIYLRFIPHLLINGVRMRRHASLR